MNFPRFKELIDSGKYFTASLESDIKLNNDKVNLDSFSGISDDPIKFSILNDTTINNSKLQAVTNPISFQKGDIPTEDGLFSYKIFGSIPESRQRQYAYIDLGEKFFHPYVFEVLMALMPKKFKRCANGDGSWKLNADGYLEEVTDRDSKDYNESNSGLKWLIKVFPNMKYKESKSLTRKDRIRFISGLNLNEVFVTKWTVLPIIYRDLDKNSSVRKLPELNEKYNNIIRYSNSLRNSTFDFFDNQIRMNVQNELVNIRKHGQLLLEKKNGFFQKSIVGKSIDRGSRDIMSVPSYMHYDRPDDNPVDIFHTGIPMAKAMILGYNFIQRYCIEFFLDNFRNVDTIPTYTLKDGVYEIDGEIKIKNPALKFTPKYIEKKINAFKNSHSTRFDFITLETEDGKEVPMHLGGKFTSLDTNDPKNSSSILNRPMTWTDLFYLACMDTLADKYMYVTRYPLTSHNSIFPTLCTPLSTIKTVKATVFGKEYHHYPVIDFNVPIDQIGALFNDTITMSNLFLAAIGGDYDGDMSGEKLCFTIEANEEAERITLKKSNFISPSGEFIRTLGNEGHLTFYNMTKEFPKGKALSIKEKEELLKIKYEDLTIDAITDLFGFNTDPNSKNVFKVNPPKFNPQSTFTLKAKEYNNTKDENTTVGRYLFNKLMIEGNIEDLIPNGYWNDTVDKKSLNKIRQILGNSLATDKIQVIPHIYDFLKRNEFWGLGLVPIFGTSYSMDMIVPNKELKIFKEKKLASLKDNKLATLVAVEDEIVAKARDILKHSVGKNMFDSGARGSFDNDFKNMAISIGPVHNAIKNTHEFMDSNYMDGIRKEDLPKAANIIVAAEVPKALGTAKGGYQVKQIYAVFQSLILGPKESDCHTKIGIIDKITKDTFDDYEFQYILDGNKNILITKDMDKKYWNKDVIIRSPLYCLNTLTCNMCMGERANMSDIDNIGLIAPALAGSLMNASMKLRHNMKAQVDHIDIDKILR